MKRRHIFTVLGINRSHQTMYYSLLSLWATTNGLLHHTKKYLISFKILGNHSIFRSTGWESATLIPSCSTSFLLLQNCTHAYNTVFIKPNSQSFPSTFFSIIPLNFPHTTSCAFYQTHWVLLVLLALCGCRTVSWSMSSLLGATSLKRTGLRSSSSQQLPVAPHLGVEFLSPSLAMLRFWLIWFCAWYEFMCATAMSFLEKTVSQWPSLNLSTPSSSVIPEPWGCVMEMSH